MMCMGCLLGSLEIFPLPNTHIHKGGIVGFVENADLRCTAGVRTRMGTRSKWQLELWMKNGCANMDGSFASQNKVNLMQEMRYMELDSAGSSSKGSGARDSRREAGARDLSSFSGNIKKG